MKPVDINPPIYLGLAIVIMFLLHYFFPVTEVISFPWNMLGIVPFVLGVILSLSADNSFKRHRTTVKPLDESRFLVTTGVFRMCRNPMYLGFALILLGTGVFLTTLTPYLVVIIHKFILLSIILIVKITLVFLVFYKIIYTTIKT